MLGYGLLNSLTESVVAPGKITAWHMRYEKEPSIRHAINILFEIIQ